MEYPSFIDSFTLFILGTVCNNVAEVTLHLSMDEQGTELEHNVCSIHDEVPTANNPSVKGGSLRCKLTFLDNNLKAIPRTRECVCGV